MLPVWLISLGVTLIGVWFGVRLNRIAHELQWRR